MTTQGVILVVITVILAFYLRVFVFLVIFLNIIEQVSTRTQLLPSFFVLSIFGFGLLLLKLFSRGFLAPRPARMVPKGLQVVRLWLKLVDVKRLQHSHLIHVSYCFVLNVSLNLPEFLIIRQLFRIHDHLDDLTVCLESLEDV